MSFFRKAIGHPEVYPLFAIVSVAAVMGIGAMMKASQYPDVVWNHKSNPMPWLNMKQTDETKVSALMTKLLKSVADEVYPLLGVVCIGASVGAAGLWKAIFYRDVVWNHKTNPEPWMKMSQKENSKWFASHDFFSKREELPKIY